MRILLVADGRSPITQRWIQALLALEYEVVLVTTFPCDPIDGVEADVCLPVAFASLGGSASSRGGDGKKTGFARKAVAAFRPLFLGARYRFGPMTLRTYGPRLRWLAERIQPDLIHALRIPYEGMLASYAPPEIPLAASIWGNDLTLHANGSRQMAGLTYRVLSRADGLHADAARDLRLAKAYGLRSGVPTLVAPGSGGLPLQALKEIRQTNRREESAAPLVVNPRGFRTGSVRQDTFFAAVPLVLQRRGGQAVEFACAAMAGQREAESALDLYHLRGKVGLLPNLPQTKLWRLFARAQVTVSVSQHDGTPNSLLEAMSLGVFPIAGDIESIREWITPGVNGLLVEPDKPNALADALIQAIDNPQLRARAAEINLRLVQERAGDESVRNEIAAFYKAVIAQKLGGSAVEA